MRDTIREYIEQANVDGVFVNVPGTLPYVPGTFGLDEALKVIKESSTARLANRKDSAFKVYKA